MFTAYKKYDNRENIIKKTDFNSNEKAAPSPKNIDNTKTSIESLTKVTYSSVLRFGQKDQSAKK